VIRIRTLFFCRLWIGTRLEDAMQFLWPNGLLLFFFTLHTVNILTNMWAIDVAFLYLDS